MPQTARVRDSTTVFSRTWTVNETANSGAYVYPPYSGSANFSNTLVMLDYVTPGYQKISAGGGLVFSPMIRHEESQDIGHGVVDWSTATNHWTSTGSQPYSGSPLFIPKPSVSLGDSTPWGPSSVVDKVSLLEDLAITKAYAGVGQPDVATLSELVELRETLAFLFLPVGKMVTLTKRFNDWLEYTKRADKAFAKRRARWEKSPKSSRGKPPVLRYRPLKMGNIEVRDIPSAWLAYRYGLMPLIYTFQDAEKLLADLASGGIKLRVTSRAKMEDTVSLESIEPWRNVSYAGGTFRDRHTRFGDARITCRAGVLYVPELDLQTRLGVRLNRIPKALWEGVPLSFVADWLQNGAEFYDALTAEFRAQKILGAWCTTTIEYYYRVGYTDQATGGTASTATAMSDCVIEGKWKRRINTTLADVKFRLRLEMNGKRIADALSLIYLFLSTGRKS